MTLDLWLAAITAIGLLFYLVAVLLRPEKSDGSIVMTLQGWLLIAIFIGVLLALTRPMGAWLFALYEGRRAPLHKVLGSPSAASAAIQTPDCPGSWEPGS